jgi:hypothetical protein
MLLLTASQSILYASSHQWNLLDLIDFMKCCKATKEHSCQVAVVPAGTTVTWQEQLEAMDRETIAQSVISSSWRATIPPTRSNTVNVNDLTPVAIMVLSSKARIRRESTTWNLKSPTSGMNRSKIGD